MLTDLPFATVLIEAAEHGVDGVAWVPLVAQAHPSPFRYGETFALKALKIESWDFYNPEVWLRQAKKKWPDLDLRVWVAPLTFTDNVRFPNGINFGGRQGILGQASGTIPVITYENQGHEETHTT